MKKSMLALASTALALGFSSSLAFADGATAVTINNNPVIDMTTKTVSITGKVTCTLDESGDTVGVDVVIKQQWGNTDPNLPGFHFATASGSVTAKCDGTPHDYQILLKSTTTDDFKTGTIAHVTAVAHERESEPGDGVATAAADVSFHPIN